METVRRPIWPLIGLSVLAAVTFVVVGYVLTAPNRDSASKLVATFLSVATTATGVAVWLWRSRRPAQVSRSLLERAADQLAEQMRRQWEGAAAERGLTYPVPISVWWQWCGQVTGPVEAAVGGDRFAPLPGMSAITEKKLRSGTIKDLFGLYGGLGSGRLVILGGPGAGKSGAAVLLLLKALTHRAEFKTAEERARVPVPVLFTVRGWDPNSELLVDWLAGRLTGDYALLRAREYGRDAAARLIDGGYIAVILDGLDEMAEALRPVALRALDEQATFRLVVLTRSQEMVDSISGGHLRGAAALKLCSLQAKQAVEYLASTQTDSAPASWQRLLKHLRDHPDGALAQALETPLMVSLVRDTYRPGDPVDELTDGQRFASRDAIENHLLDRVLPAAYTHRPGHPAPAYSLQQARRWLGHLARHMNDEVTRDLAWWKIPHWVPAWPRVLSTVLACEFVVGLVIVSGIGFARALVSKLGLALTIGLVIGFMGAFGERPPWYLSRLRRSKDDIRTNLMAGLVYGFTFGLVGGLVNGLVHGLVYGLVIGLVTGSGVALVGTFGERSPQHLSRPRWRKADIPVNLAVGLALGLTVALVFPATWQVTLTSAQLWRRGEAPVRLLRFLEDARKRQVLRTVGQVYQFRHAQLQDRLAGVRANSAQARLLVPDQEPSS